MYNHLANQDYSLIGLVVMVMADLCGELCQDKGSVVITVTLVGGQIEEQGVFISWKMVW